MWAGLNVGGGVPTEVFDQATQQALDERGIGGALKATEACLIDAHLEPSSRDAAGNAETIVALLGRQEERFGEGVHHQAHAFLWIGDGLQFGEQVV